MSTVAVVGAGTMGNGIAHVFAQAGWETILIDVSQDRLAAAVATIGRNTERQVKKGTLSAYDRGALLERIKVSASLESLGKVDNLELLVEAATEKREIKFKIFSDLDRIVSGDTILASNTSSISINDMAAHTSRPGKVIGMHFMNPVPLMNLVEVIRGRETSKETVDKIVEVVQALEKTPVVVNDYPGFVSNRVLMPMINEAIFCVQQSVATPEAVDQIMKLGMNHPIGPLALADLIGLDVCLDIMKVLEDGFKDPKYRAAPLLEKMVGEGKLGRKTGQGFYAYRD